MTGVSGQIAFDEIGDAIRDSAYIKTANTETGAWDFVDGADRGISSNFIRPSVRAARSARHSGSVSRRGRECQPPWACQIPEGLPAAVRSFFA